MAVAEKTCIYAAMRSFLKQLTSLWLALAPTRAGIALCFAAGAVAALALPPLGAFPLLFLTLPLLFLALEGQRPRAAAWRCFAYIWGTLVFSLYWIADSMLVDLAHFWWAVPLSILGLPLYLSLYAGAAGALYGWLRRRFAIGSFAAVPLLAVLLTLSDLARGTLLTGFPWSIPSTAWLWLPELRQSLSLLGSYGLTLLTYLLALTPILFALRKPAARRLGGGIVLIALSLTAWGAVRLAAPDSPTVEGIRLRLVQPNIAQDLKWNPDAREANFTRTLSLSSLPTPVRSLAPTHIIWPEAAVPFLLENDEEARLALAARTPPGGLTLVGAPWRSFTETGEKQYTNSLVAVTETGAIRQRYEKAHLVPFGEYFPWRGLIKRVLGLDVSAIAAGSNDYSAGPGPQTLRLGTLPPVSPLICYEVIFPHGVVDQSNRPGWLLNITNDGWFGQTAGPHQHFELARDRAIEEGLPLVRVANTGISGVIDGYGRVLAATALGIATVVDTTLPVSLPPTLFAQYGDMVLLAGILSCLMLTFLLRAK